MLKNALRKSAEKAAAYVLRKTEEKLITKTTLGLSLAIVLTAEGLNQSVQAISKMAEDVEQSLRDRGVIVRQENGEDYLYLLGFFQSESPQLTATPTPSATPQPTATPEPVYDSNYYMNLIKQTWPDVDPMMVYKVMKGESGLIPNIVGVNLVNGGHFTELITTQKRFYELMETYGVESIDIGLMQINTSDAVSRYLNEWGWTWYDLLDPEKNLQIGHDLYSGRIPKTNSGWCNWYAAIELDYVNAKDCESN